MKENIKKKHLPRQHSVQHREEDSNRLGKTEPFSYVRSLLILCRPSRSVLILCGPSRSGSILCGPSRSGSILFGPSRSGSILCGHSRSGFAAITCGSGCYYLSYCFETLHFLTLIALQVRGQIEPYDAKIGEKCLAIITFSLNYNKYLKFQF